MAPGMSIEAWFSQIATNMPQAMTVVMATKLVNYGVGAVEKLFGEARTDNYKFDLFTRYLKGVERRFGKISEQPNLCPITGMLPVDRFFLWPTLGEYNKERYSKKVKAWAEGATAGGTKARKAYAARELVIEPPTGHPVVSVEGGVGVGKTTLARGLIHWVSKETLSAVVKKRSELQIQYLPLYFDASDLIALAREDVRLKEPDAHRVQTFFESLGWDVGAPSAIRALFVVVDGLDEVEEETRRKALEVLSVLWQPDPESNNRYFFFGRPDSIQGIPWVEEEKGVLRLEILPWNKDEVREYLSRWTDGREEGSVTLSKEGAANLLTYFENNAYLPAPAFLVHVVVCVYLNQLSRRSDPRSALDGMPRTRVELYERYFDTLLFKREHAKTVVGTGGTAKKPRGFEFTWLTCVELSLRRRPELREAARAGCDGSLLRGREFKKEAMRLCSSLLDVEVQRRWDELAGWWERRKLCRLGHESLHEYLAARALAEIYSDDPIGFWSEWVCPKTFNTYWQQVILYALAMSSPKDQTVILDRLLKLPLFDSISEATKRHLKVVALAWGVGAAFEEGHWQDWLNQNPDTDLLSLLSARPEARPRLLGILKQRALAGSDFWPDNALMAVAALEQVGTAAIPYLDAVRKESEIWEIRVRANSALYRVLLAATPAAQEPDCGTKGKNERPPPAEISGLGLETTIQFMKKHALLLNDWFMRVNFLKKLEQYGSAAKRPLEELLIEAKEAADEGLWLLAALALGKYTEAIKAFVELIGRDGGEVEDEDLPFYASLAVRGHPAAAPLLEDLLLITKEERVRLYVAIALGSHPVSTDIFKDLALSAESEAIRRDAVKKGLGSLGPTAVPILKEVLERSGNSRVQLHAATLLGKDPVAIEALEKLCFGAGDVYIALDDVTALKNLGATSVPFLVRLLKETKERWLQQHIAHALAALEAPPLGCSLEKGA